MNYYEGLNEKLYKALPNARRVLEIGCAGGRLGAAYKQANPKAYWCGVEMVPEIAERAAQMLDKVICGDVNSIKAEDFDEPFDLVVCGDVLEHLIDPEFTLRNLRKLVSTGARLVTCVPNMGHISVIEKLICGDLTYEPSGLLDKTHLRFFTPSSIQKVLLDAGWLPSIVDTYMAGVSYLPVAQAIGDAATKMGVPGPIATRNLQIYQMIVSCKPAHVRPELSDSVSANEGPKVSVVVPATNPWQFGANIKQSPGILEMKSPIVVVEGASSAADGLNKGLAKSNTEWILYCHQDVYLPKGSGELLLHELSKIDPSITPVVGFMGIGSSDTGQKSGLCVDRVDLLDFPSSSDASSLDEFAVLIHRDSPLKLDSSLGWHLWATDLCQQARSHKPAPIHIPILRIPLFHNSYNDGQLSSAYHESAKKMAAKYPENLPITTLCSTIR